MKKTLDNILKFGKKVIKPLVKPVLLTTALLIGGNAYSQQYQDKNLDKINVFKQPNDSTLAYYGSLDVNKDNVLNWDDYNKMVAEAPQIDEADLNGNRIPSDPQDIQIAADYFNGNIEYIPAQWNKLPIREERIDWLDKMLAIDQTDTITYSYPDWVSRDYGQQTYINFHGYDENAEGHNEIPDKYSKDKNGRFNIPVFYSGYSFPGLSHGQNGANVGNNAKNPKDYVYPDQQENGPLNDLFILGENWNPPLESKIAINNIYKFKEEGVFDATQIVKFKSDNSGEIILDSYNPNLIETREQAMDAEYPLLTVTTPQQDSTYNTDRIPLNFTVTDNYFDRSGYCLNNADTTWFSTADTSFDIQSIEGENVILFIAEDKAGNQTLEEIHYYGNENYPNPFNPSTTIQFDIPLNPPSKRDNIVETGPRQGRVFQHATSLLQLNVYDINGKIIATLIDNINTSGSYSVEWNATGYPSGIYFYQLQSNSGVIATKKMLLLR